jgi:competence protein ComEA
MRRFSFVAAIFMLLVVAGNEVAGQGKPAAAKAAAAVASPVNINSATVAQLEVLPGIGTRTAQAIVDQRQKNGPYKKIEELMNVKGIGEKSFLKLKPMITVGPEKADKAEKSGDRH